MADLPKQRLTPYEPPFSYTGVDFFGPFYVKRGRGSDKVYGCVFTCFTSRAVHIEDVSSLQIKLMPLFKLSDDSFPTVDFQRKYGATTAQTSPVQIEKFV